MDEPRIKNLHWVVDLLPQPFLSEPMHDGVGYYHDDKLILILVESSRTTVHNGVDYPFQLWNGCFFPIEPIKQSAVYVDFMFLENHPALRDCLYVPAEFEDFEESVRKAMRELRKKNPLFGVPIKIKKPKNAQAVDEDFSRPRLFSEAPTPTPQPRITPQKTPRRSKANKKPGNAFLLEKLKKR